uniref:Uncharacterized protein n=1 Tax=Tetradesmus obliquus TaxID=3088 RepID=A0A383VK59_TETOB|eukprot:jgi/Sobl393_1/18586/SZX65323.1
MVLTWALQLVSAGMHITYAQLLAAADSMVAGVEVWVQAQQQLKLQSDIPSAAYTVCSSDWGSLKLPPEQTVPLLQLAVNCSDPAVAAAALCHLPEKLEPGVARKLLLTAVTRQHSEVVKAMAQLPAVLQHLDTATLELLLGFLVKEDDNAHSIKALRELPVAAQLSSDAVCRLLLAAAQNPEADMTVALLCELDGAKHMTSHSMAGLLAALVESSADSSESDQEVDIHVDSMSCICALPSALALGCSTIMQLLRSCCAASWCCSCLEFVCAVQLSKLPVAKELDLEEAMQRMIAAIEEGDSSTARSLTYMPAAQSISSGQLLQLLTAAVQQPSWSSCNVADRLCQLPAAQQRSSGQLLQLLTAAVQQPSWSGCNVADVLCQLPAAQQLSNKNVAGLLLAALLQGEAGCVRGVQQLSTDQTAAALKVAAMWSCVDALTQLCNCPAASLVSREQLAVALEAAIMRGSEACLLLLCQLPAAHQFSEEVERRLEWLLASAKPFRSRMCSVFVRRLPAQQ